MSHRLPLKRAFVAVLALASPAPSLADRAPPNQARCPGRLPQGGTPCAVPRMRCFYPACGMPRHASATCAPNRRWTVSIGTCNPPRNPNPELPL
ncbi:MAG: hypothetical protein HY909_05310 [Deltaproteobacteria bacterium]|nr:hypothetical protein [Deltaproteobacteria bacterium]